MATAEKIVEVRDLSWTYYGAQNATLSNMTFDIIRGETLGILGPALAGKTTLCCALAGLIPNSFVGMMEGQVLLEGQDTRNHPVHELSKYVGLVFDNPDYQFSQGSVEEEIALGLENRGVESELMPGKITEALEVVGLNGFQKRSPFELSGGQQQRLAIACMLVVEPGLLILDEPTSFLDPVGKAEVYQSIRKLSNKGTTIVIADHEVEYMAEVCHRILVVNKGRIFLIDPPRDVFSQTDRLSALGLRVPQVATVARSLEHKGASGPLPLSVPEAVNLIESLVRA